MPDFEELQANMEKARAEREAAMRELALARERLARLRRELERALRAAGRDSETYRALEGREAELRQAVSAAESRVAAVGIHDLIDQFSDPREQLRRLPDQFPILLFPVRLEVRFKQLAPPGGAIRHQLWVRVFPDECSIEAFDETLTESEVARARDYWINRWKGGRAPAAADPDLESFVRDRERGAWRALMGTFNAGRAYWIHQHYRPDDDVPVRSDPAETILVIPTDDPPPAGARDALRDYWEAVWRAGGDADATDAARDDLAAALGITADAATELAAAYPPHNIARELERADPAGAVQVAFPVFPEPGDIDTRLRAWSNPATVRTLPERFMLLGFQEGNPEPVIQELGRRIPDTLVVGPSPGADIDDVLEEFHGPGFADLTEDEKAERYVEYLAQRSDTRWLFDFDAAVEAGMGFRVDIPRSVHDAGFQRLFVLGVRLSADAAAGRAALERLIRAHHFGETGFAILPQGTPTNNTDDALSGYAELEDPDEAYYRFFGGAGAADPTDPLDRRDGRWLAEMLGVDVASSRLDLVQGYHGTDQREARAMNAALWNATIGYFMESMLTPVFSDEQREVVRWLLLEHVSGRGRVPAVRIGSQPYGILPATTVSDMKWLMGLQIWRRHEIPLIRGLQQVYRVLIRAMRGGWEPLLADVAHVGKSGDAHEILLRALGLHPTSVDWDLRYAQSFRHHFNRFLLLGKLGAELVENEATYRERGMELLRALGYVHDEELDPEIPILEKFFLGAGHRVTRPLIDDRELSERDPIRPYTEADRNYIEWLIDNARSDHSAIREQSGFAGGRPTALLYDMLRHSLNLAFANTGLNLYGNAEVLAPHRIAAARIDADFIGIQEGADRIESKWDLIYRADDRIAGAGRLVVDHISDLIRTGVVNSQTRHLQEMVEALERLKHAPTARLERAFVEHLDCCTYRLDAWLLGLVHTQLSLMRYGGLAAAGEARTGVYLGAYGWLENLKPRAGTLRPADVPGDLRPIFDPGGDAEISTDDANAGYVHAPSVNHALTAAVLRNAYISNASPDAAEPFKVNLSSERVRLALSMIEGIQQGQSLGALLGYQLERGLHDETDQEMDVFIYELRKAFPLVSNRMARTRIRPGRTAGSPAEADRFQEEEDELRGDRAVTKVEARNVVDGLALLDHIRETGHDSYPFGFPTGDGVGELRPASGPETAVIDAQVRRLMNIRDAVADLATAEGVHQAVQANYDRAAGALDAYSKGSHPQLPDVVRSPGSGIGLTHRVGIHLPAAAAPAAAATPRAAAEPAIDRWLEGLLPAHFSSIACLVELGRPAYDGGVPGPATTSVVTMADLGLRPIDLVYMVSGEAAKNLTALDDHVLRFIHAASPAPPADIEVEIRYAHAFDPAENRISFFELASLIDRARALVGSSRPLAPTDLALPNEADPAEDATLDLPAHRVDAARAQVNDLVDDLEDDVVAPLAPLIDEEDFEATLANAAAIVAGLHGWIDRFVTHTHALSLFGFAEAGFGWVFDRVQALHAGVYRKVGHYRARWLEKQAAYDDLVTVQLPAAATEAEGVAILQEAERIISTSANLPVPDTVAAYLAELVPKKAAFDTRLVAFDAFLAGSAASPEDLLDDARGLTTGLSDFDHELPDFDDDERQAVVLAEDLHRQAVTTAGILREAAQSAQALLDEAAASTDAREKVKLVTQAAGRLFGEDFKLVPRFTLGSGRATELQQCLGSVDQLLEYQTDALGNDFPVDDWLYGVARVREKMGAWEGLVMIAEGLRDGQLELTPLQLPYTENDSWLAAEHPPDLEVEGEKLLYTAHAPGFDPAQPQCGLLVDEWTEVIPAQEETTGLTFHFDQPNSEPPQAMLLATPAEFTGGWSWTDLVRTLHETLDLARLRAVEPDQIDRTDYARFLPATVTAVTRLQVTIAMSYAALSDQIVRQP